MKISISIKHECIGDIHYTNRFYQHDHIAEVSITCLVYVIISSVEIISTILETRLTSLASTGFYVQFHHSIMGAHTVVADIIDLTFYMRTYTDNNGDIIMCIVLLFCMHWSRTLHMCISFFSTKELFTITKSHLCLPPDKTVLENSPIHVQDLPTNTSSYSYPLHFVNNLFVWIIKLHECFVITFSHRTIILY